MELKYDDIKNLVVSENWEGNQVKVKFKASNQNEGIETLAVAMPSAEEIQKRAMMQAAKSAGTNIAISAGANALGNLAGVGGMGSVASSAAGAMGVGQINMDNLMHVDLTDEVKQNTILNAFRGLQMYFVFDNGQWVYKQPGT